MMRTAWKRQNSIVGIVLPKIPRFLSFPRIPSYRDGISYVVFPFCNRVKFHFVNSNYLCVYGVNQSIPVLSYVKDS